jgi:hypothetical protein
MSNFLFRMVEKAVGSSPAMAPQPRGEFHWPASERPARAAQPLVPFERPALSKRSPATVREAFPQRTFPDAMAQPEGTQVTVPFPASDGVVRRPPPQDRLVNATPPAPGVPRVETSPVEVRPISAPAAPPGLDVEPAPPVVRSVPGPRAPVRTPFERSAEERRPASQIQGFADAEDQGPIREILTALGKSARAAARTGTPAASTQAQMETQSTSGAVLPRETAKPPATPATAAESSQPDIDVRIGRVEIRFDTPVSAPAAAPSKPAGFEQFRALRTYAARPWPRLR